MEKIQRGYYGYKLQKKSYEEYQHDLKIQELKQLLKQRLCNIIEYYLSCILGWSFLAFIFIGSFIIASIAP